ncbi:MAG: hypothetical protein QM728_02745 [Gordonia sp. (in: high G+C Gram-positive bacteria)]|uniref:hypothetical protein n=1 Tax=Gordonia sp. (in: high G+C Gram-positive bacteria) TaxID=84139 RepID=UPI0039E3459F
MNHSRGLAVVTGVALIAAPVLALLVKLISFGWLVVMLIFGFFVPLAVWILLIVIAKQGFLTGARDLFGPARVRATIAAWLASIGVVVTGFFVPDGGDTKESEGSTFQVLLGVHGPDGDSIRSSTNSITGLLTAAGLALWAAGFLWLFVEWVNAWSRTRKAERMLRYPPPPGYPVGPPQAHPVPPPAHPAGPPVYPPPPAPPAH